MAKQKLSDEVTHFLNDLNHPLRNEIDLLRKNILAANDGLRENIKWNGPNFCVGGEDRITMKIHPPKQIQLIFHRGVKAQQVPKSRLIADDAGLLIWRTNDRAMATFKNREDVIARKSDLDKIINAWIKATVK